jgi:hypothetical protein
MRRSSLGLTLLAVSVVACQPSSDGSSSLAGPLFDVTGPPVIASGDGSFDAGDGLRVFTFHAIQHPDGSVSGSYRNHRTDLGTVIDIEVSCMSVVGNTAWIGGHIVSSNIPSIVIGSVSYFYAIDNGEGQDAPADVVSVLRVNDAAGRDLEFCTNRPLLLAPRTVQYGNVQIM